MSLATLHIATKGFLAGTTLAIATSGFIQPDAVEVPVKPFAPSQLRYVEPRKVEFFHTIDYELESVGEIRFAALSKYEAESNYNNNLEHNSLRLITFSAASNIETKNVRVTELKSESQLNFFAESSQENLFTEINHRNHISNGNLELSMKSDIAIKNKENNNFTFNSEYAIRLYMKSNVYIGVKPNVNKTNKEIDEVLAVAIKYLYG